MYDDDDYAEEEVYSEDTAVDEDKDELFGPGDEDEDEE